nr:envelope glycoprotein N [Equid gammaherpesvirus 5]UTK45608.1 envelope glycoprotein N [Equid gammaherpesvirus 5]UTK45687.1 envelope glycoprotein N [Equid gammaherpesvirus 5]UTK45766.1 envelope glycoprotein N [Equid gammaherpesvirus 5]
MKSEVALFICACMLALVDRVTCSNNGTATFESVKFYSYDCSADTYAPKLTSFSTVWTLLNVLVMTIACVIYLIYMCFNKFVNTMAGT